MRTIGELKQQLSTSGTLSEVLQPGEFALEGQVADVIASRHKDDLKPTQTRRIFHTIKELANQVRRDPDTEPLSKERRLRLTLLAPELAYAVGRKLIPMEFYEVIKLCLRADKLKTAGDLRRLVEFLSSVVAYQKFHS